MRKMAFGLIVLMMACAPSPKDAPAKAREFKIAVIPQGATHEFWKAAVKAASWEP
ncbi:MAG: hypothetical protein ABI672_19420 [Vicinamibacteria bacterium]